MKSILIPSTHFNFYPISIFIHVIKLVVSIMEIILHVNPHFQELAKLSVILVDQPSIVDLTNQFPLLAAFCQNMQWSMKSWLLFVFDVSSRSRSFYLAFSCYFSDHWQFQQLPSFSLKPSTPLSWEDSFKNCWFHSSQISYIKIHH